MMRADDIRKNSVRIPVPFPILPQRPYVPFSGLFVSDTLPVALPQYGIGSQIRMHILVAALEAVVQFSDVMQGHKVPHKTAEFIRIQSKSNT